MIQIIRHRVDSAGFAGGKEASSRQRLRLVDGEFTGHDCALAAHGPHRSRGFSRWKLDGVAQALWRLESHSHWRTDEGARKQFVQWIGAGLGKWSFGWRGRRDELEAVILRHEALWRLESHSHWRTDEGARKQFVQWIGAGLGKWSFGWRGRRDELEAVILRHEAL